MRTREARERPVFLRAEWRNLVLVNYEVDEALLRPLLPRGTEFDRHEGRLFISLVAFQFLHTRVCGMPIPFHVNFPEVNLRFYVRRRDAAGWRRGVVFVKELVPRWAIAKTARWIYGENYVALPMAMEAVHGTSGVKAVYRWRTAKAWHGIAVHAEGSPGVPEPESHAAFLIEHYYGYTRTRRGTYEYGVEHPPWRIWSAPDYSTGGTPESVYESDFAAVLNGKPYSVVLAEGSDVLVRRGVRCSNGRAD